MCILIFLNILDSSSRVISDISSVGVTVWLVVVVLMHPANFSKQISLTAHAGACCGTVCCFVYQENLTDLESPGVARSFVCPFLWDCAFGRIDLQKSCEQYPLHYIVTLASRGGEGTHSCSQSNPLGCRGGRTVQQKAFLRYNIYQTTKYWRSEWCWILWSFVAVPVGSVGAAAWSGWGGRYAAWDGRCSVCCCCCRMWWRQWVMEGRCLLSSGTPPIPCEYTA